MSFSLSTPISVGALTFYDRIHKTKYNDDGKFDKKARSKSKPRKSIFGIKGSS